jgi:hypothetical protein
VTDLSPAAVEHLWPFVQLGALALAILGGLVLGLWRGFRWLQEQIERTAQAMLAPIAKDVVQVQASAKKAHRRIARIRQELNLPPDHQDEYETQE